ncbi:hypothetical protein [Leptospira wolbachii]|nr:hypothetical protein [Leptospira wolbachii]
MKTPNPSSLILALPAQKNIYTGQIFNGCLVTAQRNTDRFSICFAIASEKCKLDFFQNLKTEVILQKRKDDLTFININLPNCSVGTGSLFAKYNAMFAPASSVLKDYMDINGPIHEGDILLTSLPSCGDSGFLEAKYLSDEFLRLLNSNELGSTNSVEVELAMIESTTSSCIDDLSFQSSFLPILTGIREKRFARGIPCSFQNDLNYELCPNL